MVHQKIIVCNCQGFRGNKQKLRSIPVDEHNNGDNSSTVETVKRRVKITRIGCRAYVRFALLNGLEGPAMIDDFSEFHNHHLTSISNRDLEKISRCLDMFHKHLILDNSKCEDFQTGERDADLFLDRHEKLKATQPQFYFAYDVDASNCLTEVIWADSTSIRNYTFFEDAVSFDPTYGTNKYDFQLEDDEWLSTMFTDRKHWIPAYHRDLPMGCILRTTQRSESANSFFKRFQTDMDQQRYTQRCDDYDSDHSLPSLDTNIHLEKHGAIVYTHAVFKMFQEEVKAAISCGVAEFDKEDNLRIIFVEDAEANKTKVTFNLSTTDAECACKLFEKIGLLCRHIVWVYKGKGIRQIPSKLDPNGNVTEDSNMAQCDNSLVCKQWAEFSATVGVLKTLPPAHMDELATLLVEFREKLFVTPLTKDQEMEMLLGCSSSSEVTIRPPVKAHNKGIGKRLTLAKTQAIEKPAKLKRLCAYCNKKVDHDKRTCPLRIAEEAAAKAYKKRK
ncbi:uncharacterized protein LOC141649138 [Silene latifolia]|uniref:uncharacterized protein LOC141649138 n=1 Tax=Silene latifolia TaxID=37657 RepID=UPI003D77DC9E